MVLRNLKLSWSKISILLEKNIISVNIFNFIIEHPEEWIQCPQKSGQISELLILFVMALKHLIHFTCN